MNQGAQVSRQPNVRRIRQAWAALAERVGAIGASVAALPVRDALSRLAAAAPAAVAARTPVAAGARGYLELALGWLRLGMRAAGLVAAMLLGAIVVLVVVYRWVNPPISALMLGQSIAGTTIERTWVPLERVSPYLIRAVVMSEDGRFCAHGGVDWPAMHEAITHDRGGSTITMQVVKNLFLWPSRSYVRKFIEMALAYVVEAAWPKHRILEIYLNIAEWGDGVFGAEAAAQTHFGKSAARLSPEEAARMAVALPSPLERAPGQANGVTGRLAGRLLQRMAATRADLTCVGAGPWPPIGALARPVPKERLEPPVPPETPAPKEDWDYLFPSGN